MNKDLRVKIWKEKSQIKHNFKYNYDKVEYINAHIKVCITCNEHGDFWQSPNTHVRGGIGCLFCINNDKNKKYSLGIKEFINKSNIIFNNKYNYDKAIYINNRKKICIICPEHGEFWQVPSSHLKGYEGCKKCLNQYLNQREWNTDLIIKLSKEKFLNLFEYDKTIFVSTEKPCIFKCKIHGYFEQTPYIHLNSKYGCPKCAVEVNAIKRLKSKDDFIKQSILIHKDKYIYDLVNYINDSTPVKIICKKHGEFNQIPNNHLSGKGCKFCIKSISKSETLWLDLLEIPKAFRNKKIFLNNRTFIPDAIDNENKIIYEFLGDYWHGNLEKFLPNKIHPVKKVTFKKLNEITNERINIFVNYGYKVMFIWENDWVIFNKSNFIKNKDNLLKYCQLQFLK